MGETPSILFIDDDPRLAQSFAQDFKAWGFHVHIALHRHDLPENPAFDYAVIDMRLANGELGLDLIPLIKQANPRAHIVVLSGYGSIATAVEATKRGASHYLLKPISSLRLQQALEGTVAVAPAQAPLKPLSIDELEKEYIDFVLIRNQGNISKTARELGLHRQSLQRKLKKLRRWRSDEKGFNFFGSFSYTGA